MISYFKNFFKTFKDRKLSFKISFVVLVLLWIFLLVITVVPLNYEMTTPGVSTKATADVYVVNGNNRDNIYTLGVYGKRKVTIFESWLLKADPKSDLEPYDPKTQLDEKEYNRYGTVSHNIANINAIYVAFNAYKAKYPSQFKTHYNPYLPPEKILDAEYEGLLVSALRKEYDGPLKPDDLITHLNGKLIVSFDEFLADLRLHLKTNDDYELTIVRNYNTEKETSFPVTDRPVEKDEQRILPYYLEDYIRLHKLEPLVLLSKTNTIGSSGGAMTALAIYDAMHHKSITLGLNVVGTGAIDMYGNIKSIGGVRQKIITASYGKFDVFFVPQANYEEAKAEYDKIYENKKGFDLVAVSTFSDILAYFEAGE